MSTNKIMNEFKEITYKGEKVMSVTHTPSGTMAVFDNDPNVLNRILEESKIRRASLTTKKDYPILRFNKTRGDIPASSLASVVYSEYHNIPLKDIRKYHIRHIENGEIEDCRKCNLYSTGDIVMESPSIKFNFSKDKRYFELLLKTSGKQVIFDNNDELFKLLATPHYLLPFMNTERPQVRINGFKNKEKICEPYLSLIAYACYHQGLTVDNHLQLIPEIMKYNKDNYLQVEHLNGDIFNNRRYNLTLVKGNLNLSKKDIMKYITSPFICNVVLGIDNRFRMLLGRAEKPEDLLSCRLIILDTFTEVLEVLKAYKKVYPDLFKIDTTNSRYLFREPIVSETLSTMSADKFTPYKEWLAEYGGNATA